MRITDLVYRPVEPIEPLIPPELVEPSPLPPMVSLPLIVPVEPLVLSLEVVELSLLPRPLMCRCRSSYHSRSSSRLSRRCLRLSNRRCRPQRSAPMKVGM
jgi:hypothetical protein